MGEHKTVEPSQEDIERAEQMWRNFTVGSTYGIYGTVIVLIGLALAFVKFA